MNWALAIERNRTALLAVVAAIIALIGGRQSNGPMLRAVRNAALALLRPAESACRRLIVIAARGLLVKPMPPRPFIQPVIAAAGEGRHRTPAFRLMDRANRYRPLFVPVKPAGVPRIRSLWRSPFERLAPPPPQQPPAKRPLSTEVDDSGLLRRLAALEAALANLPRQARRFAHWRARQRGPQHGLGPRSPLRVGVPPGYRLTRPRDIDDVLKECNLLAHEALQFDTS
jgi:hypothetical protein